MKKLWKLFVGGLVTGVGFYLVAPQFQEVQLTGAAVVGVAILAVGVSVLAEAFN